MKKITILLIILLTIGCTTKNDKEIETNNQPIDPVIDKETIVEYVDNNPIKIGIYNNNKLITNYSANFINGQDLAIFDIYYTNLETVNNNSTKVNYKKYYNEYQNIENYKTGFYISFEADGKVYEETILDSTKTHSMGPFLYVYLYDDVNQPDYTFYSHIEPNSENENTIFSSIKLYLFMYSEAITSPITLTVFTYDSEDDFDENNHYRGNSSHTVTINKI